MKARSMRLFFRVVYLILALYAYFGGRCPVQGCPACKLVGK